MALLYWGDGGKKQQENRENFVISHQSSATMRRVSFNMHPWPYVKFM
jgi:hypothetical protein